MDVESAKKVLTALEREGVRYVVFDAVAINLLGLARATEDLDLFIAPELENIERLKAALRSVFADPSHRRDLGGGSPGGLSAVQYNPPSGEFHLDILTRLGEAFQFQDLEAVRIDLDGVPVSVASPQTLYRMKRDTVRPKDRGDAEALRRRFRLEGD